jgi:hypothetical protein
MFMSDILKHNNQFKRSWHHNVSFVIYLCLLAFSSKPDKPNRFDNSSSILAISIKSCFFQKLDKDKWVNVSKVLKDPKAIYG